MVDHQISVHHLATFILRSLWHLVRQSVMTCVFVRFFFFLVEYYHILVLWSLCAYLKANSVCTYWKEIPNPQKFSTKSLRMKGRIYWPFALCPISESSCLNICVYFGSSQLLRGQLQPCIWPAPLSSPRGDPHSPPPQSLPARKPPHQSRC